MFLRPFLASLILLLPCTAGEPEHLFNGKDLTGWTTADGSPVTKGWQVEPGGVLHRTSKGGDIYTAQEYGNFDLTWEWKIGAGGNSGLKYRVRDYPDKGKLGFEYQLLDDASHPDSKVGPQRQTASLYDILPPAQDKILHPPGEWNTSRVVVRDTLVEHWLNGKLVLKVDLESDVYRAGFGKSKFRPVTDFARNPLGRIMLQDHNDEVWFRNISLKRP